MNPMNRFLWRPSLLTTLIRSWFLIPFLLSTAFGFPQTTNINGIINTYHSVTAVIPSIAAVKVDNVSGLGYGNLVVLIQMKGATIIQTNTSTFGDTTSLNNAGNYEIATICSLSNDTVYFFHELLNSYTITDKVQLVKFGEYFSAIVADTVKAQSWNNTTGKGGVIAIKAEEDLTLNAPIFADSTGYKGGAFYLHNGTCGFFNPVGNGYAYDATSATATNGAYKGEGVSDVPSTLDGARGAPANGGGGGNNHNNGGGGGANLTSGGNAGGNFSTGPTGCTGNYQGLGGKPLSNWNNTKIFAGGGGGAGHANSTVQTYAGGNGGGIIIVIAKNIIGNGYKISANGQNGRSTSYDGASGGGAGGTIIMHVINGYTGTLTVQANGGNGGNEDDDLSAGRCYGAGGGGSGGVVYFNGSVPAIVNSVTGGTAGINIDPNSCGVPVPAVNGTNGLITSGYSYRTSVIPSNSCGGALPVNLIYFNAFLNGDKKTSLRWEVTDPNDVKSFTIEKLNAANNWDDLAVIESVTGKYKYETFDPSPAYGENLYRLRINGNDNSLAYSLQKRVVLKHNNRFNIYPNPAKDKIIITGNFNTGTIVKLTDINGRLLKEKMIHTNTTFFEFVLPSVPTGLYFIKINNEVIKIIIN